MAVHRAAMSEIRVISNTLRTWFSAPADRQLAAVGAHPLEHADDHAEPGGVEEVDAAQVDHQVGVAAVASRTASWRSCGAVATSSSPVTVEHGAVVVFGHAGSNSTETSWSP